MRCIRLLFAVLVIGVTACKKSNVVLVNDLIKDGKPITTSSSFYPMQIGNYWKVNDQNYTEIVDTVSISGKLFYEFNSLVGGDAIAVQYLRIDENQNLVESYPTNASYNFIHAEFNANLDDKFHSLNNQTTGDFYINVAYKSATKMTFYGVSTNPVAEVLPFTTTYYKGIGPDGKYTTIKIDGNIYNYTGN